jgi:hypothetical protein
MAISFIERIISLFSSLGDAEAEKKRQLKQIGRVLAKHRFKFYKVRGEEVLPALAKYFYDTYRLVAPAQVFMQNVLSSAALKNLIIDNNLEKESREIQERLSEESIAERFKTMSVKDLSQQVRDDMVKFFAVFDANKIRQIDASYNAIVCFASFVNFDYFFLLKKFDSNISERSFTYIPKFEPIRSEYIVDDIKDYVDIVAGMDFDQDWRSVFEILRLFKGVEVVPIDQWNKHMALTANILRSEVFEYMVRHIDKDPRWQVKPQRPDEHIVEAYLQKLKTQTEVVIQKSLQEKRNEKIDDLAKAIFGTPAISRMKNYTEKANLTFSKKMLGGYIHVQAMNYLKAFLLDYFKKDIRELVDLMLIRGQWSAHQMSQILSEAFHTVMKVSEQILIFDDNLGDDSQLGGRLRSILAKSDRDKEQIVLLRNHLKTINEDAQKMVNTAAQNLIVVGKNLKGLLDDHARSPHDLIVNWKEIELASDKPIAQRIAEVYKQIYLFIQLMQNFTQSER